MTPFQLITSRLERASTPRTSRAGTSLRARCPACGGDNRSKLIVTEKPDGAVLLHCFAGCGAVEIVSAMGLEITDLFPAGMTRSRSMPGAKRHDAHTLAGAALDVIEETQHLLLQHAVEPVPGIAQRLADKAAEIGSLRELIGEKS